MKLIPHRIPHRRNPRIFGSTVKPSVNLKNTRMQSIRIKLLAMDTYEDDFLPFSPALAQSSGIVPIISPIKTHINILLFFSMSQLARPDNPTKPKPIPVRNASISKPLSLIVFRGDYKRPSNGLYIPNAAHSVPPLIPGIMAPNPTIVPFVISIAYFKIFVFITTFQSMRINDLNCPYFRK